MIEVTSLPTMEPVPRARVQVSGLPSGSVTLTVWRSSKSGPAQVRAGVEAAATDPFTVVDYAVPWNEDVTYWADFLDESGALIESSERATTRVVFFGTVMHQPLDPSRRVAVQDLSESARVLSRSRAGDHARPGGGRPVWIGDGSIGLSTRLKFALLSDSERMVAESMFGTSDAPLPPILCLRTSLPLHLPQPFIFLAAETPWQAWDHFAGGETTVLEWEVVETSEPALGLLVSPFSYEDIEAWYATYEDLEADPLNPTYEALEARTDLAGAA